MLMNLSRRWERWCLLVLWIISGTLYAADRPDETLTLELSDRNKISIARFGNSLQRVLWIPAPQETNATRYPLARSMAEMGLEVWLPDLEPARLGTDKTSVKTLGEMIQLSFPDRANGKLHLFTSGQSTVPMGMGLQLWQATHKEDKRLGGLLLAYPDLTTPTESDPVSGYAALDFKSPVAVYIFQPERSGTRASLDQLSQTLQKGGSVVFLYQVPGVSDDYLQLVNGPEDEVMQASIFPAELKEAIKRLNAVTLPAPVTVSETPAPAAGKQASHASPADTPSPDTAPAEKPGPKVSTRLEPYPEAPLAPDFSLKDIKGKKHTLKKYQGKVVVLNFWATWCPPCIKEIPSLGRLQKQFSKHDLVVLSIDVGEEKSVVQAFLKNIPADYPVLLDEAGDIIKEWKLHAFPSTFVIDPKGHIKLAFYGGLEWDDATVVKQLEDSMGIKAKKK